MISQAFKDLSRLREISLLALKHGFGELLDRTRVWEVLGRKERVPATPESQRESTARRFRRLLSELGPTFVKLGQILSARPDMLPREYVQELALLQDAVPPEKIDVVLKQIETAFGQPSSQLFSWIDETPLASASIAQVHRARTADGQEVVVKVQRPGIAERIRADLDLLHYAATILEAVVEETGIYTPTGIVEEFDRSIGEELDFLNEAGNIRAFYRNHQDRPYVAIPKVYDELTRRTVLTMEFLRGEKVRTLDPEKIDREKLAKHLMEASFRQVFEDGLFHGDPHPGNILLLEGDRIGLLDFGVVGRITKQMQENLVLLVLAVGLKDADTVARLLYRVAAPDKRANLAAFRADIQGVLDRYLGSSTTLDELDARQMLPELLNLAVQYHIRIPKEYALISRAAVAVEGMIRWLYPKLNVGETVLPFAKELLLSRYEGFGLGSTGMRALLRLQTFATDVPMQLSQILLDMESGKFHVNVASDDLNRINSTLKGLGFIAFTGLLACGLTIAAAISFTRVDTTWHGVPVVGAIAVALIGALCGTMLTWLALSGRVKKISVRKWMDKAKRQRAMRS